MTEPTAPPAAVADPQPPKKKSVHPLVTVLAALALLGFIGWQYVATFGMPRIGKRKPIGQIVMEKVEATGGDIRKVSKEEMNQLNDLTMGNGERYYKIYAKQYAEKNAASPSPPPPARK